MDRRKVRSILKCFQGWTCPDASLHPSHGLRAVEANRSEPIGIEASVRFRISGGWLVLGGVLLSLQAWDSHAQTTSPESPASLTVSSQSDESVTPKAETPTADSGREMPSAEGEVALQRLAAQVRHYQDLLSPFGDDEDLFESLYQPLFDRPYRRASVGILLKITRLLEAEVQSRRAGHPILTEGAVRSMTSWCDATLRKLGRTPPLESPVRSKAVRRNTLNVKGRQLLLDGRPTFLMGWIDRSRMGKESPVGDLDLMACLGADLYAQGGESTDSLLNRLAIEKKCDQLGIGYIDFFGSASGPDKTTRGLSTIATSLNYPDEGSFGDANALRPQSLDFPVDLMTFFAPTPLDLLTIGDARIQSLLQAVSLAGFKDRIVDSDLTASLLTRQIISSSMPRPQIGLEWRITSATGQVIPTPREWRAAMWSQLFAGQRGGLFEGWRDPRRSDWLPNESVFLHPALLETQAHTSLDARRVGHLLSSFPEEADVAILVGRGGVAPELSVWSKELIHLHHAVRDEQIAVDVCPISMLRNRYPLRRYKSIVLFQVDGLPTRYFNRLSSFSREGIHVVSFGDALREDDAGQPTEEFRFALWAGADEPGKVADFLVQLRENRVISVDRVSVTRTGEKPMAGVRSWVGRLDNGQPVVGLVHRGTNPVEIGLSIPDEVRVDVWKEALTGRTYPASGHVIRLDPMDVWLLEGIQRSGGVGLADGSVKDN
jgi:hypothetical protein